MKQTIEDILQKLTQIKVKGFGDIRMEDGRLTFLYYGGRFFINHYVEMGETQIAFLEVVHKVRRSEYSNDGKVLFIDVKVDDFLITITNDPWSPLIKMKNFLDSSRLTLTPDAEGMIETNEEMLPNRFALQFIAKLQKDKFKMYLE